MSIIKIVIKFILLFMIYRNLNSQISYKDIDVVNPNLKNGQMKSVI